MVSFTFCTLATLALSACVAAIPDAAACDRAVNSTATFTFSEWIEGIIANPGGEHLTPLEAVEAKNVAIAGSPDLPLSKRYNCDQTWGRANVSSLSTTTWARNAKAELQHRTVETNVLLDVGHRRCELPPDSRQSGSSGPELHHRRQCLQRSAMHDRKLTGRRFEIRIGG